DLHLFTRRRNAARTYDDAVGVNLSAEAAVGQAIAHVLGALQVEVGRALFLATVTVDHELGARICLQCRNHAILQDILTSVVHTRVVALEGCALAKFAGLRHHRWWWRRRHSQTNARRAAGRAVTHTGGRPDSHFDRRSRCDTSRIERGVQTAATDRAGGCRPIVTN